jgi:hypothetical protein
MIIAKKVFCGSAIVYTPHSKIINGHFPAGLLGSKAELLMRVGLFWIFYKGDSVLRLSSSIYSIPLQLALAFLNGVGL